MGRQLDEGVQGPASIALPKEYSSARGCPPRIAKQALVHAAQRLETVGRDPWPRLASPALDYALPAYYVISSAEASSNLARFDGVKYGCRAENYDGSRRAV